MNNYQETTKRAKADRDGQGRYPGAPAWTGDLRTVSPTGLTEHERGLMAVIANLTVKAETWNTDRPWRTTTAAERRAAGLDRWIIRLVECRTELERRYQQIGVTEYIRVQSGTDADLPWPGQQHDDEPGRQRVEAGRADDVYVARRFQGQWAVFDTYLRRHIRRGLTEAVARQRAGEFSARARQSEES